VTERARRLLRRLAVVAIVLAFGAGALVGLYRAGYVRLYPDAERFPVRGIDVSHHQGRIDWAALRAAGVDFAYIKATEGGDHRDRTFRANWSEAARVGLARGAYHFFTFCRAGREQARNFIATVPAEPGMLPPAIDFEFGGNCRERPERARLLAEVHAFADELERHYRQKPLFYVTYDAYDVYLAGAIDDHPLWVRDIVWRPRLSDGRDWTFWQYAHRARLPGISGPVDLNVFNGSPAQFARLGERPAP
jgi:lysozyme